MHRRCIESEISSQPGTALLKALHSHVKGTLVYGLVLRRPIRPLSGLVPALLITLCLAAMLFYSAIS